MSVITSVFTSVFVMVLCFFLVPGYDVADGDVLCIRNRLLLSALSVEVLCLSGDEQKRDCTFRCSLMIVPFSGSVLVVEIDELEKVFVAGFRLFFVCLEENVCT